MFPDSQRSGLQAGKLRAEAPLLQSHAAVQDAVYQYLNGNICYSKTCKYFSALMMHRRVFHFDSLHLVSSLHGIALTYTCGWTQVNTNNDFFKCSWSHAVNFHDRITSVLNAVPYEGLNITGIQSCFSVWSLAHRVFSSFSKSFHDAIFKVFTFLRWGTLFWNSSTI